MPETFKKTVGNYVISLERQIIIIKKLNGELVKGIDVNGANAASKFKSIVKAIKEKESK